MRRSLRVLPLVLLFASASCSGVDDPPGNDGQSGTTGAGTGGVGALGGSAGSAVVGGGGNSGTATGGTGTGGSAIAGASSGGVGGASAGAGAAGSSGAAATGGSGGAGNGGANPGGANPGGAGSGGVGNGGSGGSAGKGGSGGRGGTAGASGSTGGGGTSGFNPCPATGDCKILPLGDSITDGLGVPGGGSYRIELFHLALTGGKHITYVGGSMNGPTMVDGQPFPRSHEGHSGWTIAQIDGIVPSPGLNPDPHIVLLHIGTNDMGNASGAPARLATLIDQIVADLPNSLLVVAKIIPLSGSGAVATFNTAIAPLVQTRADMGKHVILVDQNTGFPNSELADGVHPNAAGYQRMARVWYAAISGYLH